MTGRLGAREGFEFSEVGQYLGQHVATQGSQTENVGFEHPEFFRIVPQIGLFLWDVVHPQTSGSPQNHWVSKHFT